MHLKSVAVFCGSKPGNQQHHMAVATQLGYHLAAKGIQLIYGGGNKGLMGAVANAVLEGGGTVVGIIPKLLTEWEHQHEGITELLVVDNMHTRKRLLYERSDAAVILPGGFGTLDELFEILTWNQLRIHHKPVFLINAQGFYDHLIAHIRHLQQEGFLYPGAAETIEVLETPEQLVLH